MQLQTASDEAPAVSGSVETGADSNGQGRRKRAPQTAYRGAASVMRERRLSLNWTLDDLADRDLVKAQLTGDRMDRRSRLSAIERGKRRAHPELQTALTSALGLTVDEAFEAADPANPAQASSVGDLIRSIRVKSGWSQTELGRRVGRSGVAISYIESGKTNPPERTLERIAEALEVDPSLFEPFSVPAKRDRGEPVKGLRALAAIRHRRVGLGLEAREFADCACLDSVDYLRLERGERRATAEQQVAIARRLLWPIDRLFDFDETLTSRCAALRERREQDGLTQVGWSRASGLNSNYASQLEAGSTKNPSAEARAALAATLGDDPPEVVFAGWPPPESEWVAERRRLVVELSERGESRLAIARLLGISPSTVDRDIEESGHVPPWKRVVGKTSAARAAEQHGLDLWALCGAISAGIVRGERLRNGRRFLYFVDEHELAEDLATLPICGFEGCDQRALSPKGGCCGGHSMALTSRGHWWTSLEGQAFTASLETPEGADLLAPRCWLCREPARKRYPAVAARAVREKRRAVCDACSQGWSSTLFSCRHALARVRGDGRSLSAQLAFAESVEIALAFEERIHGRWTKRGHPPHVAVDVLIEAAHVWPQLSDPSVARLLNWAVQNVADFEIPGLQGEVDAEYVRKRRQRGRIMRPEMRVA